MIGHPGCGGESRFEVLEDGLSRSLPADAVDQIEKGADDAGFDRPGTVKPPLVVESQHRWSALVVQRLGIVKFHEALRDHELHGVIERCAFAVGEGMIGMALVVIAAQFLDQMDSQAKGRRSRAAKGGTQPQ